ncbi:hypothetical protein QWY31_04935 [Cytophagales bacterium LB-30]|uniref:Glycosyltransferase RgtA/B/C/D-like domain-containing protein n=1 Tax=Shiella aurantiaca TaxID=3058365 RepID=A0ABT8F3I5_9BACT|nr:hypothetical protein [Shiella aurantiaca]MDN4164834.1 hypothetical protein [Shiella aurantiaca]
MQNPDWNRGAKLAEPVLMGVLLALVLVLYGYATWGGLITTQDSLDYLSAAQSFRQSGEFLSPDGSPYAHWPPFYPLLLAIISSIHLPLVVFHAFGLVLITILLYVMARHTFNDLTWRISFWVLSLLGVYMLLMAVFVWSELYFTFLLLLLLVVNRLRKYLPWADVFLVLIAFALCLQRSAGFFVLAGLALARVLENPSSVTHWLRIALGAALASSGFLYWQISRSLANASGYNLAAHYFFVDFWHNVGVLLGGLERIFIPFSLPFYGFAFLFGIHLLLVWKYLDLYAKQIYLILGMYLLGYACMQKLDAGELDRYLAPIVPLVFLVVMQGLEAFQKKFSPIVSKMIIGLVLLLMFYSLARTANNVPRWHERPMKGTKSVGLVEEVTWEAVSQ